ncbi:alpha/beta fold hydrolase [Saccharopolyspora sp. CA-218241]|uniref:alpha/beta fold hydrolase n=1 Tax=Saccharopolyspora sp. CA-218241 TaxID=3240027 RepID=UPI003D99C3E1
MTFARITRTAHRHVEVDGVRVFYRESLPDRAEAPVLLLLHGFPSASHQFRRLIDVLGAHYRLIAPDLPGFGHTETPDGFVFSFDRLAEVIDGFVQQLGLDRFVMYVFDYGAPTGFRLAERHPSGSPDWSCRTATPTRRGSPSSPATCSPNTPTTRAPRTPCGTSSPRPPRAASTRPVWPRPNSSPRTAGSWTSTSSTSRSASAHSCRCSSTTTPTSSATSAGRPGCASTPRPRSSPGAATTRSSPNPAAAPTCATCPMPNSTSSTPATSPSKTTWARSRR